MAQRSLQSEHWITILVVALVLLGAVILSSASAIIAFKNFGRNDYYFWNQMFNVCVGIAAWLAIRMVPYAKWREFAPMLYIGSIIALILVFIPGIRNDYGTAHSWIMLPSPLPNIQPIEFAKLGMIFYLAYFLEKRKKFLDDWQLGFLPFLLVTGLICGLLALQPDNGNMLVICAIAFTMYFVAGGHLKHFAVLFGLAGLAGTVVAFNKQYVFERFVAFLDPFKYELDAGYQIVQGLVAVGSGGFFGKGFGASRFKYEGYLPEAQSDYIFAIASEELGFVRVVFIVLAFALFAWHGYLIAEKIKDDFGKFVVVGITTWIIAQACINMMVILSLFPNTGLPLPFISYGGSAMMANLMAIGVLLNVAYHGKESASAAHGRRDGWSHRSYTQHREISPGRTPR